MTGPYRLKAVESIVFVTFVRLSNWVCVHKSRHDQTASHRLKLLNSDKRNAVMALLADEEWLQKGSRWIAASLDLIGKQVFSVAHAKAEIQPHDARARKGHAPK
jgi:hypothetical protein